MSINFSRIEIPMGEQVTAFHAALARQAEASLAEGGAPRIQIRIGSATCEDAAGALEVREEFRKHILASGREDLVLDQTGCTGLCSREPIVGVRIPGQPPIQYERVTRERVHAIFASHILQGAPLAAQARPGDTPAFTHQTRIAMRNCGVLDPDSLEAYVRADGFKALAKALDRADPQWLIDELLKAKLRGRGGGGYLTSRKWQAAHDQKERVRYLICNGDEGDPGAFKDRGLMESDPFGIVEGMILGAYAIQAAHGFLYIRAEYPLAVKRIQNALDRCRAAGLLGPDLMGSGWDFDLEVRLGGGAFVCGEETALIRSIEGKRGQPKVRPPYPTERGLWGRPTCINNVETFASVPAIVNHGGDGFARVGTPESGGTKVLALAGHVKHTGLVEVPLGTSLRRVVFDLGGGVEGGRALKAIQTGGPAGSFLPAEQLDLELDYGPLARAGSIMGSGGMIVLSEDDCVVDLCRFHLAFTRSESCGQCTPCREGTTRMLEILTRITQGTAVLQDLAHLERLARLCQRAALCGLGRAAPNPVLSSIKHFREEYLEHILYRQCRARHCASLAH